MILAGKKALVTGSSRGIGKAIAAKFLSEGATVWGICTKPSTAKSELEELAKANNAHFYELYADASDGSSWSDVVKNALEQSGGLDILVNNAGITRDGLSFRMKMEDWNAVINVNLTAAFVACQLVAASMIRNRKGSIINMSSIVGIHGQGGQTN